MGKKNRSANGMNSIYKTPDNKWIGQIVIGKYANGNLKYKRWKRKTRSEVVELMKEYERMNPNKEESVTAYLEDYLQNYVEEVKQNKLKPASYIRELTTCSLIKKYIGAYPINELTAPFIQTHFINQLKKDGYAYSSIHKAYVLLNECLRYAHLNNHISDNPCIRVEQPVKRLFVSKPIRFLTEEEIKTFISQATAVNKKGEIRYKYGLPMCLIIYTGLRCGELCVLKWSDIDTDRKIVKVQRNYVKSINGTEEIFTPEGRLVTRNKRKALEQQGTKTSSGRIIKLNKQALQIIEQIKQYFIAKDGCINLEGYILNNTTDTIVNVDVVSKSYTHICNACGITNPLGIHTLRHTFASLLIKKNVDIKVVSEILGHTDVAFTYNTYVHLCEEQKFDAVDLIDIS